MFNIPYTLVKETDTAESLLNVLLPVCTAPYLIAFIEYTCFQSIASELAEDMKTVGTYIDIKHISASPVGSHIRCESKIIKIDGKNLVFNVKTYYDFGLMGEGTHKRLIIKSERFMQKVREKADKLKKSDYK